MSWPPGRTFCFSRRCDHVRTTRRDRGIIGNGGSEKNSIDFVVGLCYSSLHKEGAETVSTGVRKPAVHAQDDSWPGKKSVSL